MQRVEPCPDQQVEKEENPELVESADKAFLRQAPQEEQLESAGEVTK